MITFPILRGIEINLFQFIFIGLTVGIVGAFIGVGGGYMITPALLVISWLQKRAQVIILAVC